MKVNESRVRDSASEQLTPLVPTRLTRYSALLTSGYLLRSDHFLLQETSGVWTRRLNSLSLIIHNLEDNGSIIFLELVAPTSPRRKQHQCYQSIGSLLLSGCSDQITASVNG